MTNNSKHPGKVYLVGAGPGDPGLITLRGKTLLEQAEVVVYDYLANPKLLKHALASAEKIYVGKKGCGLHAFTQEEINQMLIKFAGSGKRVVRLKGGDPFIFGRGAEEIEKLVEAGIDFEVVPGVTSATAAATYAGIPITHREYTASVAFITGHEAPGKKESSIAWDKLATGAGTIVIYMGIKNLPIITEKLIRFGRAPETPVAVVRWASTPQQYSVSGTLATIAGIVREKDIKPPALIIVGEVVKLRSTIDWFEKRPLFGKRMVVTRTREQASELVALLEENGADCLEFPTLHMEPVEDYGVLEKSLNNLSRYQWIIFTSINGITWFFMKLMEKSMDARNLAGSKIAVIGKATADKLLTYGLSADLIPEKFTGEGLAEALIDSGVKGSEILLPRAVKAREILPDMLFRAGATVTIAPVYKNVPPKERKEELRQLLENREVDLVTFTSSSTVSNFISMIEAKNNKELQRLMKPVTIAAIGPITAKRVQKYGLVVDIQPKQYTITDMVRAIVANYQQGAS
jgi:uroporphyrinogen III methyltransferase/synthase